MKYSHWIVALLLLTISASPAAADPPDYSGRWKINLTKSSMEEIYPESIPQTILDIKLEGALLSIRRTIATTPGGDAVERRYTTDGKECLNSGKGIKDLKGVCRLENGRILISCEMEGAMATMAAGSGAMSSLEYFRYEVDEEYSLSADGRELTLKQTLSLPDGKKSIRLLFERS